MNKDNPPLCHKYALTLEKAQRRTRYWRDAIAPLYGSDVCNQPHGFFVHMKDLIELTNLGAELGEDIVGVRIYFTFNRPQAPDEHHHYPDAIHGIFVPVTAGAAGAGQDGVIPFAYYEDLIVPISPEGDDPLGPVSVYDVTEPCPPLCDLGSDLYKDPA